MKTGPKQLLGYLPLALTLPDLSKYVQVPFAWLQMANTLAYYNKKGFIVKVLLLDFYRIFIVI
jgi:hypothetical protein